MINVIKFTRVIIIFLLSQHKHKGCHNQGIPADLFSLYTVVTCITFMLIYWRCLHTPRNIFLSASQQKQVLLLLGALFVFYLGSLPTDNSEPVPLLVDLHRRSPSARPPFHHHWNQSLLGHLDWISFNIWAISAALFGFRNCRPREHLVEVNKK